MSIGTDRNRITVTFTNEDYQNLKSLAAKNNISMSEQVRIFTIQGLSGKLTENNFDVIAPIIRNQLKSLIEPMENRIASLTAKTFIEAATASLLTAETIHRFVSEEFKEDVVDVYEKSRKKAIRDMKRKEKILDEKEE